MPQNFNLAVPKAAPIEYQAPRDMEPMPEPGIGAGYMGKTGAIAEIGANILHGWLAGQNYAAQKKVQQAVNTLATQREAYEMAKQNYQQRIAAGEDPQSESMQRLSKVAVQQYGEYVNALTGMTAQPEPKGKGGKAKKGLEKGFAPSHMQPELYKQGADVALKQTYAAAQKDPSVLLGSQMTPAQQAEEQAKREETVIQDRIKIQAKHEEEITGKPVQPERLRELEDAAHGIKPRGIKKLDAYVGEDGKRHVTYQGEDGKTFEEISGDAVRAPAAAYGQLMWEQRDGRWVSLLRNRQTNQPIPGTENYDYLPPASITGQARTGFYYYEDDNHMIHQIPTTTTTTPLGPRGGGGGAKSMAPPPSSGAAPEGTTAPAATAGTKVPGEHTFGPKKSSGEKWSADERTSARDGMAQWAASLTPEMNSAPTPSGAPFNFFKRTVNTNGVETYRLRPPNEIYFQKDGKLDRDSYNKAWDAYKKFKETARKAAIDYAFGDEHEAQKMFPGIFFGEKPQGITKPPQSNSGTVVMTGPQGTFNVPVDQQQVFEQNGYSVQKQK